MLPRSERVIVSDHVQTRLWSAIIAVVASAAYWQLSSKQVAVNAWYGQRLAAMGLAGPAESFREIPSVLEPMGRSAFEAEGRALAEAEPFRMFLSQSKAPRDLRWEFPPDARTQRCPPMTMRSGNACRFLLKPGQTLWNIAQGGVHGRLESVSELGMRSSFFRADFIESGKLLPRYAAQPERAAFLRKLRDSPELAAAAKALFNASRVEPDAVYGNLLLPEQELGIHTDVPAYYGGLNRSTLPVWLLTAMSNSRIFDRWQRRIATAVIIFPTRRMKDAKPGSRAADDGAFTFYPASLLAKRAVASTQLGSAVLTDTDAIFHGVNAPGGRDTAAPTYLLPKGMRTFDLSDARTLSARLSFDAAARAFRVLTHPAERGGAEAEAGAKWDVRKAQIDWNDVRFSISWKAFVHRGDADADEAPNATLTVERVFDAFADDMARRGVDVDRADPLAFATAIVRMYNMPYFVPNTRLRWNVCAAADVATAAQYALAGRIIALALWPLCG
jgi:hypothetical protein